MKREIKLLKTKVICVVSVEGGRVDVYRPSDSKYQNYLKIYNNKNKINF
jgi:hypothetical protein